MLSELEAVGAVTIFDDDTPLALIESIRPDILVKGGDYQPEEVVGRAEVEASGGRLVLIPLFEGHSTTGLLKRATDQPSSNGSTGVPPPHLPQGGGRRIEDGSRKRARVDPPCRTAE